jgi:glycerol-3-phosphate dehydrogenase
VTVVSLNQVRRSDDLLAMRDQPVDVLVIGGGVVGAGAALDAVSRGLRTALVESQDWASGTSSRSSKLIHGGLRYLEMLDFGLVREALRERGLLLERIAPHLVHPIPFLYPLTRGGWERVYAGTGVALYDLMALGSTGRGLVPHHRHLTKRGALRLAPALRGDSLSGAIVYYDAQVDDARHTMNLVRTAATFGALVANRTRVIALEKNGDRVTGARLRDLETGSEFVVHAKAVVSATGVWTDQTQSLAGANGSVHVRASKGVHFLVARERLALETGLILRTEKSVLFVIPWGRHWIVGTTDTDWVGDHAHPTATQRDIEYLLERVNSVLGVPLRREDIQGVYAGLRPLVSGNAASTAKLSREHVVLREAPGLVSVAGGKYTTYRVMAKDVVDEAVRDLARSVPPSCTADLALVGADGWTALWNNRAQLAGRYELGIQWIEHLLGRYGSLTTEVLDILDQDRSLAEPVVEGGEYLGAEFVYAARSEGALHLEDALARRTHVAIESSDQGRGAALRVAQLMAPELGWSSEQVTDEVSGYLQWADREVEGLDQP